MEAKVAVTAMRDTVYGGCGSLTRDMIASATQPLDEKAKSQIQNVCSLSRNFQNL